MQIFANESATIKPLLHSGTKKLCQYTYIFIYSEQVFIHSRRINKEYLL